MAVESNRVVVFSQWLVVFSLGLDHPQPLATGVKREGCGTQGPQAVGIWGPAWKRCSSRNAACRTLES